LIFDETLVKKIPPTPHKPQTIRLIAQKEGNSAVGRGGEPPGCRTEDSGGEERQGVELVLHVILDGVKARPE